MENRLIDVSTIYHSALHLFPYWTKETLEKWEKSYVEMLKKTLLTEPLSDFYKELSHFSATLNDGHTLIYLPKEVQQPNVYPIVFDVVEGSLVITQATEEYQKYLYKPIAKIDSQSTTSFLNSVKSSIWYDNQQVSLVYYQKYLSFFHPKQLLLTFETGDLIQVFPQEKVTFVNNQQQKNNVVETDSIVIRKKDNKVIIKLNHFLDEEVVTTFYDYMDLYKKADTIIFDVRGNMGGNSGFANEICSAFYTAPFETELSFHQVLDAELYASGTQFYYHQDMIGENQYIQTLNHQYYNQKIDLSEESPYQGLLAEKSVIILQNRQTYSSAENFVMNFCDRPKTCVIGTYSAGSTGQPALIPLKTGGTFMVTAKGVKIPNGKNHHNSGIKPDIMMEETLKEKLRGEDRLLDYALETTV